MTFSLLNKFNRHVEGTKLIHYLIFHGRNIFLSTQEIRYKLYPQLLANNLPQNSIKYRV